MSFSLGRPDTLGMNEYHNRHLPIMDDSETMIIPCMVDFGKIMRKVSVEIYHSRSSLRQKVDLALCIEKEMDDWVGRVPAAIRPKLASTQVQLGSLREPKWARRQRLVLGIRKSSSAVPTRQV